MIKTFYRKKMMEIFIETRKKETFFSRSNHKVPFCIVWTEIIRLALFLFLSLFLVQFHIFFGLVIPSNHFGEVW